MNDAELREAIDQAEAQHFVQAFAERGAISHVSAGNDDMVRDLPLALLKHFEGDGLLPFDAKWIDGVGDVDGGLSGEFSDQAHAVVKISGDFANDCAVVHGLSKFRGADLALRQQDGAVQFRAGRVSGEACGGITGAGADHRARAEQYGLGYGDSHARIFE